MSHFFFIAVSYGVSLLGLGLLTVGMLLSYRSQQRALASLEARGLRRRARPVAKDAGADSAARRDSLVGTK